MPCFHPLEGFRSRHVNTSGKRSIVFDVSKSLFGRHSKVVLPCGQCVGCRLERSRQWAIRCMHEAQLHASNCFITLTFNDKFLPKDGSLDVVYFQKFMKRLRKRFGNGIRYFHCGEYGERYGRPHYHACIFGFDFPDKSFWKRSAGCRLYTSEILADLWSDPKSGESYGYTSIGDVTFESAAYVARYIMKKVNGKRADLHYAIGVDEDTGEVLTKKPEYTTMSRRPGIASDWFEKFSSDVFPSDEVIVRGKSMRPPKFYSSRYELANPESFAIIKSQRKANALKHKLDCTPERLAVREQVQLAKLDSLVRPVD